MTNVDKIRSWECRASRAVNFSKFSLSFVLRVGTNDPRSQKPPIREINTSFEFWRHSQPISANLILLRAIRDSLVQRDLSLTFISSRNTTSTINMEESFPRGGGGGGRIDSASAALRTPSAKEQKSSSTSTSTKRKAQQQAQAGADKDDFLFGSRSTSTSGEGGASGKKKRRKSSAHATGGDPSGSGSSSMLPLGGGAVLQPTAFDSSNRGKDGGPSKAALIESLSFNKLGKGTRLLGLVRDVAPDYAVVSLPNMLTGFVRRAKATDIALTDVYTPGTMMAFSIVKTTTETVASSKSSGSSSANGKAKTETRRRIELTASPQVINADLRLADLDDGDAATTIRGKVISCEDHGCIVDLGLAGLGRKMAFLRYENVEGGYVLLPLPMRKMTMRK